MYTKEIMNIPRKFTQLNKNLRYQILIECLKIITNRMNERVTLAKFRNPKKNLPLKDIILVNNIDNTDLSHMHYVSVKI